MLNILMKKAKHMKTLIHQRKKGISAFTNSSCPL